MHLFFQTDLVLNAIYYYFFFFSQKLCPELSENLVKIKRAVYKEHKKGLDVSVEAQRVRRKTAAEPFVFSVKDMSALYKIPTQHHTHTQELTVQLLNFSVKNTSLHSCPKNW